MRTLDMQLHDGTYFDFLAPERWEPRLSTIAHSLSRIARFNGHTLGELPYSVASHSVLVSHMCDPGDAREGLMHDAAESIIGDITSSLKRFLGHPIKELEKKIELKIAERFGLRWPWPASVAAADLEALRLERRYLLTMATDDRPWRSCFGDRLDDTFDATHVRLFWFLSPTQPKTAMEMFLERAKEVGIE